MKLEEREKIIDNLECVKKSINDELAKKTIGRFIKSLSEF